MSIDKISIAIFSNLPSGGAQELYKSNVSHFKKVTRVREYCEGIKKTANLFDYLYVSLVKLPIYCKKISEQISSNYKVLVVYHSWITKSPYILRYSKLPTIYICHEPMREYSDPEHIRLQTFKEKIINCIRLPIKYVDKKNLKSENLKVIANSFFSKKIIDNYYNISSSVIYPGIDCKKYYPKGNVPKLNQVISVGSINKLKGYEFLVRVISKVDKTNRPNLVLVGNGVDKNYMSTLKNLAAQLEVSLIVKINLTESELIREYQKSLAFIYAPINEPFGIVVEEAMASGLSILAYSKGGGYAEILNSSTGILENNKNTKEWANSLSKLMSKKISYANIKYVSSNYSDILMNKRLLELINKL